jgi:hypothetical protein
MGILKIYIPVRNVLLCKCFVLFAIAGNAQKFHFGLSTAVIASQVDGDNLRGFNKLGYNAGVLGGFSLDPTNAIAVELQYAVFGSNQSKETGVVRLETEIKTLNILCAYALRLGDSWDGVKKFRLLVGPRLHAIQSAKFGDSSDRDLWTRYFVSANVAFGVLLADRVILDLGYNHGLTNILRQDLNVVDKLNPYYLSLGLTWYLSNPTTERLRRQ